MTLDKNETDKTDKNQKTSLEDLFQLTGNIGWYQIYLVAVVTIGVGLPGATGGNIVVFTQAAPDHRCLVPELDSNSLYNETEVESLAIPSEYNENCEIYEYSQCQEYKIDWSVNNNYTYDELMEITDSDRNEENIVDCQNGYFWDTSVYDSTAAEDFEMVCTPAGITLQVLTTSINYVGFMVGSLLTGWACDSFGRKWVVAISETLYCVIMFLGGFTQNQYAYLAIRFLQGFFGISAYLAAFCYLVEIIPVKYRGISGYSVHIAYVFGLWTLTIMAYFLRDWRDLMKWQIVFIAPCLCYLFMPESPAYLMTRRKLDEVKKIFVDLARKNKVDVDGQEIQNLLEKIEQQQNAEQNQKDHEDQSKNATFIDLFKTKNLTKISLKTGYIWLATSMIYYGVMLNAGTLPVSIYISMMIFGLVDFLSHVLMPILLESKLFGRKYTIFLGLSVTGVCCLISAIAVVFKPCENKVESGEASNLINIVTIVFSYLGRFFISGTFGVVYQFSGELYPTPVRSNGVSLGSFCSKLGTTFTPAILALRIAGEWLPGAIFAGLGLFGAVVVLTLPETRDIATLSTMEEAERFYEGEKNFQNGRDNNAIETDDE